METEMHSKPEQVSTPGDSNVDYFEEDFEDEFDAGQDGDEYKVGENDDGPELEKLEVEENLLDKLVEEAELLSQ